MTRGQGEGETRGICRRNLRVNLNQILMTKPDIGESLLINLSCLTAKPTGLATYAMNIFPELQRLNPTLLVPQSIPPYKCYPVPTNLSSDQGTKGHIRRLTWTQLQLPKICHKLRSRLLFSPIPEAPLFSRCRYVVTVHDLIPLRFPVKYSRLNAYFRYYVPRVLEQSEHIICDSESTAKDITNFYNIPYNKISPILLAHDANNFRFLDLPTSNYFLYIGRHDPYKNLQRLILAFAALPNYREYELWIAGPSDRRYTSIIKAFVEEKNLTNVKFLDYVDYRELPVLINRAIALVFPSLWEGFGLPVLEAMACGTPVITSNLSSLPEVAGDAAILINPYNVEEITEAMRVVAQDGSVRNKLRQAGIARSQQFSWTKTGQATAAVLQRYI
jgi:glycosyltransferase involved in cell wall biosynthesis